MIFKIFCGHFTIFFFTIKTKPPQRTLPATVCCLFYALWPLNDALTDSFGPIRNVSTIPNGGMQQ